MLEGKGNWPQIGLWQLGKTRIQKRKLAPRVTERGPEARGLEQALKDS